jgi:hypothetical protein
MNSLQKEDIFEEKEDRLILFEILLNDENSIVVDKKFLSMDFWIKTIQNCKSIMNDLENLDISFQKIKKCLNILGEKFEKRLEYICKLGSESSFENKSEQILNKIKNTIEFFDRKLRNIDIIIEYNTFMGKENKDIKEINDKLSDFSKKISENKLNYLNSEEGQSEYSKLIDEKVLKFAIEILELRNSRIFMRLFNEFKEKENHNISEENLERSKEFTDFKKLKIL